MPHPEDLNLGPADVIAILHSVVLSLYKLGESSNPQID